MIKKQYARPTISWGEAATILDLTDYQIEALIDLGLLTFFPEWGEKGEFLTETVERVGRRLLRQRCFYGDDEIVDWYGYEV